MNEDLSTNILTECAKSVEFLSELIPKLKNDKYYWKWVIITLHNSCQNFMAAALTGTNGFNAMPIKTAVKWIDTFEKGSKNFPNDKLDFFCSLYEKIKSDLMMQYVFSKKFTPKDNEDNSIIQINEIRNSFIHYTPQLQYTLITENLPTTSLDILYIIKFLAFESGNIFWYISDINEKNLQESIENVINLMTDLKVVP